MNGKNHLKIKNDLEFTRYLTLWKIWKLKFKKNPLNWNERLEVNDFRKGECNFFKVFNFTKFQFKH